MELYTFEVGISSLALPTRAVHKCHRDKPNMTGEDMNTAGSGCIFRNRFMFQSRLQGSLSFKDLVISIAILGQYNFYIMKKRGSFISGRNLR